MKHNKSFEDFLLFGRTCIRVEDISDDYFLDLLFSSDAYVTKEDLTPEEIIEKYGEILTKEQIQIIYGKNKL